MAIRWFAGLVVAALVGAQPAAATVSPGIVGGQPAAIADYPWVVSLVDQNGFPFCDGTLTAPTTIVTAAHCLLGRTAAHITVVGGRTDLGQITKGDSLSGVSAIDVPPTFVAPQTGDDIATLTLTDAFPYQPLPPATHDYPADTVATAVGWGSLGAGQDTSVLHQAQVPIVDDQQCGRLFGHFVENATYDAQQMLCAGGWGAGICTGDAGGPLVVDGTLVGIASWSIGCGRYPDFYTRVSDYPNG